jgi:hypothetical protein
VAKNPPAPAPEDAPSPLGGGKGRPTPSRAEREGAHRRPLVANTKEAKARARAEMNAKREKARVGMAAGDERYLPPRDKGPQRKFARDWVDSRWSLGEFILPVLVVFILLSLLPYQQIVVYVFLALWSVFALIVIEMIITSTRVKRAVRATFGADKMEKGLGWYAAMRQVQMRFMRLPKPQVKRGGQPVARG